MGGDGGVIASNRRYMRGAGTADHTADYNSAKQLQAAYNNPQEVMTTCALTRTKFNKDSVIVACRFGRLYLREAAIQELLERKAKHKKNKSDDDDDDDSSSPLAHVRKLSELYTVRFDTTSSSSGLFTPICPVTAKTLTGSVPAILLVPGKTTTTTTTTTPNVVSESSWKQLSESQWQEEYGPITQRIRLAPPPMVLEELKATYAQEVIERNAKKKNKKNKKKRKEEDARDDNNDNGGSDGSGGDGARSKKKKKKKVQQTINKPAAAATTSSTTKSTTQNRVESAIESNKVLSSLFTKKKSISEKEHKDNLFARS